jgi:hypothetical protein
MFTSIFGTVVEVKARSTKDRLERKKYMGVCRCGSEIVDMMMSRFPSIVTRYMDRNSPKRTSWILGSSEIPIRRNSEICVSFFCLMWLMWLPKKGKKYIIILQLSAERNIIMYIQY